MARRVWPSGATAREAGEGSGLFHNTGVSQLPRPVA